jgi:hypothetical protein
VEPAEDAVRVLRHAVSLCKPGGVVLDLTTVPPAAVVERDGAVLGSLEQEEFLARAAVTEQAVDLLVAEGRLSEEASVPHAVLKHLDSGPDLLADVAGRSVTSAGPELRRVLERADQPLVERSYCLLRRLRVTR